MLNPYFIVCFPRVQVRLSMYWYRFCKPPCGQQKSAPVCVPSAWITPGAVVLVVVEVTKRVNTNLASFTMLDDRLETRPALRFTLLLSVEFRSSGETFSPV